MGYLLVEPYLLAIQEDSITIAWEMDTKLDMQLHYHSASTKSDSVLAQSIANHSDEQVTSFIYYAHLTALLPGTTYSYELASDTQILFTSNFTIPTATDSFTLMTIGDTHSFELHKQLATSVRKYHPNFILHSGDISFGTGEQREQYINNWFQLIAPTLNQTPIYYTPGNHDSGKFFDNFFLRPIDDVVHKAPLGNSYSVDYRHVHFCFIDSNPWGLFEMNAQNSDAQIDEHTRKLIEATVQWMEEDLSSPEARKATWRILISHHPYTDILNNQYIKSLVEKYGVELIISGHIHYYTKAIVGSSLSGKQSIFISQGTLQQKAAHVENIMDKRLLEEFPEIVAVGQNNFGVLEITPELLYYNIYGYNENDEEVLIDSIVIGQELKALELRNILIEHLDNVGTIKICGEIYNPNPSLAKAEFTLLDNITEHHIAYFGPYAMRHNLLLEPWERRNFVAYYKITKAGEHRLAIANQVVEINVFEQNQIEYLNFKCSQVQVEQGVYIISSVEIRNNIDREIFTTVPLFINQQMKESKNIHLTPYQQISVEFVHKVIENGKYNVSIGNTASRTINISGSIKLIPHVNDSSKYHHYGLIHGTPRLIKHKHKLQLCLEKPTDYIEVPPARHLVAPDGFSTIVSASIQRLAKEEEMGHNPLMVRGKSVGWGATYLFRMVVERNGKLKWGICHDITEQSWQGGQAKLNRVARYALAFDKLRGGKSYVDGHIVAEVSGIKPQDELRQWENQPIFIGYSYIGHIIPEIGRPKYYTHLNAHIAEVKFYTTALTSAELQEPTNILKEHESQLALDFDFSDILTIGSHITEWKCLAEITTKNTATTKLLSFHQLIVKANIPYNSSIIIIVEVSDNKIHLKDSMEFILQDGKNFLDLEQLSPAQYIRIHAKFNGSVDGRGTFAPEIFEYKISVTDGLYYRDFYWGTNADWLRGTFKGAVHIPPTDRLAEYPEYTDIIHG